LSTLYSPLPEQLISVLGRPLHPCAGSAEDLTHDAEARAPGRPGTTPRGASPHAEEVVMTEPRSQCTTAGVAQAVDTWYATTTDGDTVVLAFPDAPAIWLVHRPHAQVYWQTEGRRGLTLSLVDARQRLAIVQGRHSPGTAVAALRAAAGAGHC